MAAAPAMSAATAEMSAAMSGEASMPKTVAKATVAEPTVAEVAVIEVAMIEVVVIEVMVEAAKAAAILEAERAIRIHIVIGIGIRISVTGAGITGIVRASGERHRRTDQE